jgi:CHAD domain-containing protein
MSYRIEPHPPLVSEVRRIAAEEIEGALKWLAAARGDPDKALHECRKRLKSLRALLRLVRSGDETFYRMENARYREAAAKLAAPREAGALVETVDRLCKEFPKETAKGALDPIRSSLVGRRADVLGQDFAEAVDAAVVASRTGLAQIERLALADHPEHAADILADGVRKTMRRARMAVRNAKSRGDAEDFHDLRKAVKTHSKHLSLMKKFWPSPVKARRKSLDALGERLGELHDLFVLRSLLRNEATTLGGTAEALLLDNLAGRSERRLSKTCLVKASKLFGDRPRRSARKVARRVSHNLAEHRRAP